MALRTTSLHEKHIKVRWTDKIIHITFTNYSCLHKSSVPPEKKKTSNSSQNTKNDAIQTIWLNSTSCPMKFTAFLIFFFFIQVMIQSEISVFLNVLLLWQCFSEQLRCWWKRGGGNAFTSPSPSKKTKQSPHKRRRRINKIKGTIEREREKLSR